MGRVILSEMISLDGFFEAPGEGLEKISWFRADEDWMGYSIEMLRDTGALLFGRKTYEGIAGYWPSQQDDVAGYMNALPKVVFSRTLKRTDWNNSWLAAGDAVEEVAEMKRDLDKNLMIFGSADFASTLTEAGLIDEYRIAINPIVMGAGTPLFKGEKLELEYIGQRLFKSGIVELRYARAA